MTDFLLTVSIQAQLKAFLSGFHELISPELISIFNEQEMELLICGLPDIGMSMCPSFLPFALWCLTFFL
jgi:E3 ubiquitin-protein ligase HUWE1